MKFKDHDIVLVLSINPELEEIHGEKGEILGCSDEYEDGTRDYGVFIFRDEIVWQVHESDLRIW
jgi:hypothetical protein